MNLLISNKAAQAFGLNNRRLAVESLQQASQMWSDLRDASGCGVSEIGNGGNVLDDNGKRIATISYNGRIWQ
jgi:hypothetical protein